MLAQPAGGGASDVEKDLVSEAAAQNQVAADDEVSAPACRAGWLDAERRPSPGCGDRRRRLNRCSCYAMERTFDLAAGASGTSAVERTARSANPLGSFTSLAASVVQYR